MTQLRISEAAVLLGVSDDTVRRWAESGRLQVRSAAGPGGQGGRQVVDGAELARLAVELADTPGPTGRSARNTFPGIVTRVVKDAVMAQVDVQAGSFRVVSLMSREAADELALEVGSLVTATVKATNVVVQLPDATSRGGR